MATKKITDLTAVNLISGSAVIPIVQDGTTVKITFANLTGSISGLGGVPATASYALTAATASYAISASYEISYEVSSSYSETATSASHALQADNALTASLATTAVSASYAFGIRVDGLNNLSSANNVKLLGITGVNVQQIDAETAIATIVSSSYATTASLARYANIALTGSGTFSGSFSGSFYAADDTLGQSNLGGGALSFKSVVDASGYEVGVSMANAAGNKFGSLYLQPYDGHTVLHSLSGPVVLKSNTSIVQVTGDTKITGSLRLENALGNGGYTIGVINNGDAQMGTGTNLNMLMKADGTNVLYGGVYVSASLQVDPSAVLTLTPSHPLPFLPLEGSFAVSGSTPPKPYFWDGSTWNALY